MLTPGTLCLAIRSASVHLTTSPRIWTGGSIAVSIAVFTSAGVGAGGGCGLGSTGGVLSLDGGADFDDVHAAANARAKTRDSRFIARTIALYAGKTDAR